MKSRRNCFPWSVLGVWIDYIRYELSTDKDENIVNAIANRAKEFLSEELYETFTSRYFLCRVEFPESCDNQTRNILE